MHANFVYLTSLITLAANTAFAAPIPHIARAGVLQLVYETTSMASTSTLEAAPKTVTVTETATVLATATASPLILVPIASVTSSTATAIEPALAQASVYAGAIAALHAVVPPLALANALPATVSQAADQVHAQESVYAGGVSAPHPTPTTHQFPTALSTVYDGAVAALPRPLSSATSMSTLPTPIREATVHAQDVSANDDLDPLGDLLLSNAPSSSKVKPASEFDILLATLGDAAPPLLRS